MRYFLGVACVMLVAALVLAGCGKSDEMKKLEAGLNTEVMQKHDEIMKAMNGMDDVMGQLSSVMAKHDSLAKRFPKLLAGTDTKDIAAAKEKLVAAKDAMTTWMKGFKPYDPNGKHEEVMTGLKTQKDQLTAVEQQMQAALTGAKEAIASHQKMADDLMAKMPMKKK